MFCKVRDVFGAMLLLAAALGSSEGSSGASVRHCEEVPRKLLDESFLQIQIASAPHSWNTPAYQRFLSHSFESLRDGGRICYLNQDVIEDYLLNTIALGDTRLYGFYDPNEDAIFIDKDLPKEEFGPDLNHELDHAVQYRYRYPLDLSILMGLTVANWKAHGGKSSSFPKQEDLPAFLDFYYEAGAQWHALTFGTQADWNHYWRTFQTQDKILNDNPLAWIILGPLRAYPTMMVEVGKVGVIIEK